jgi:hypothetical protein
MNDKDRLTSSVERESSSPTITSSSSLLPSHRDIKSSSNSTSRRSREDNEHDGGRLIKTKKIRSSKESSQSANQVTKNRKSTSSIESGRHQESQPQDVTAAKSAANTVYFDHHLSNEDSSNEASSPSSDNEDSNDETTGRRRSKGRQSSIPPHKQVSWDDKIEFPSSTPTSNKQSWPDSDEVSSTSTSVSSAGELGRLGSKQKSNNKAWVTFPSSSTSTLRISNRFGALRQTVGQQTRTTPLVEDFKSKQNLRKLFNDAISDMENKEKDDLKTNRRRESPASSSRQSDGSFAKVIKGKSGRIRSPVSSLRLMNERQSLLERSGLKTAGLKTLIREDVSNENFRESLREREEEEDEKIDDEPEIASVEQPNDSERTVTTTTKTPRTTDKEPWKNQWPNAKVTQYFSWETPSINDESSNDNNEESGSKEETTPAPITTTPASNGRTNARISSSTKGRRNRGGSQRITTTTEESTTTAGTTTTREVEELSTVRPVKRANRVFSENIKTTVNQPFQRIRVSSSTRRPPVTTTTIVTTTTEFESGSEETTPGSRPADNSLEDLRKTYEDWRRDAVNAKQDTSGKGSSIVSHSGNGYGWSANIDHSNQRPAEIRTSQKTTTAPNERSTKKSSNNDFVSSIEDVSRDERVSERVTGILEVEDEADNDSVDITTETPVFTRVKSNTNKASNNQGIKRSGQIKGRRQNQVSGKQRITTTEREETTTAAPTTRRPTTTTIATTTTATTTAPKSERIQVKGRQISKTSAKQRQTRPGIKGLPRIQQERQVTQVKVSGAIKTAQGVEYLDNEDQQKQNQDDNSFQQNSFENDRLREREENTHQGVKGKQVKTEQIKIGQQNAGQGKTRVFQKKSGVDYSSASVEREDDISKEFVQKSGQFVNDQSHNDNENCRLEDAIPGLPLRDYPTYDLVPQTSFKCSEQSLPGYYGDVEAQCQVCL